MSTTFKGDEEEEKNHSLSLSVNARALKGAPCGEGKVWGGGRRVTFYGQFEHGRPRKA